MQTWDGLKTRGIKCNSGKNQRKLFAYGQINPIETLGTFYCNVICQETKLQDQSEFVVIKSILGKSTAEKLNLLRVGPPKHVYSIATEGEGADVISKYPNLFKGIGKLKGYELDLHIDERVKPVAQPLRRLPFYLWDTVENKLD